MNKEQNAALEAERVAAESWYEEYAAKGWSVSKIATTTAFKAGIEYARAQLAAPAGVSDGWTLAADQLPKTGQAVLAYYLNSHGMSRRIRAMHVKRFTVEAEEFADPETQCCEYSEQDDCYYTTEGWYELIDNWPDYSSCAVIEGVITHWMPMPSAPSPAPARDVAQVPRELLEMQWLEQWMQFAAEPIGQECCNRPGSECCGCPDICYRDGDDIISAMHARREELRALLNGGRV
jgi:hypothetical protein